ncbi:50S ribosomal subunit protein L1 [Candidatus Xenohaliotis californiensis]|uniref:Ribosomal protein n=1 Tax=Candidatus Xenohaliotis californiensis TaxID=84677 RepID=A0ABM9N8D6_9RICK|nr:50S ribosomal subunit protein L1 [Candidatus Xenohaliotis californiensis]
MADEKKIWFLNDALSSLIAAKTAKFNESIDMSLNLTCGAKNTISQLRGVISLPYGTGKNKKVAVIAKANEWDAAKVAGADYVGDDELLQDIAVGKIEYDCYIATPSMMSSIAKVAKILGPKGLMPNTKSGTVTTNFASVVPAIKQGTMVEYKADKKGVINMCFGNVLIDVDKLAKNLQSALSAILNNKPSDVDKMEIKSIFISSTMGKSYRIKL